MSNGQAERFVDTLKRALSKAQDSAEMLQQFLRGYRATPNPRAPGGLSPAKIIYGRRIRLPLATVLPPQEPPTDRELAMERQFNIKHGPRERSFVEGEEILLRQKPDTEWRTGKVIEPIGATMYNVLCGGRLTRAHTNQLRAVPPSLPLDVLFDDPAPAPSTPRRPRQRKNWRAVTRTSPVRLRARK